MALNLRLGLQIGTESASWPLPQFTAAAQRARALGVDTLIVKIADGSQVWYAALGGGDAWAGVWNVLQAIQAEGIQVLPYLYSYGNRFGAFQQEVNAIAFVQARGFEVCLDMESEWNGQAALAGQLAAALGAPIWVSTWADPAFQDWNTVLAALAPKTRAFLPQVYTPFLAARWQQQYAAAGIPASQIIPTLNNQTLGLAAGRETLTLWEYNQLSDADITQVRGVMSMLPSGWTDDGTTLTAPNGQTCNTGFRHFVLANTWDAGNVPLAPDYHADPLTSADTSLGAGERQDFRDCSVGWTAARGYEFLLPIGQELATLKAQPPVAGEPLADAAKAALKAWLGV